MDEEQRRQRAIDLLQQGRRPNDVLRELAHALGCCTGPGTSGGHFVGLNCTRILCSPHGNARTLSDEELRQMGLEG